MIRLFRTLLRRLMESIVVHRPLCSALCALCSVLCALCLLMSKESGRRCRRRCSVGVNGIARTTMSLIAMLEDSCCPLVIRR
jgi:hypothetical protein